MRINGTISFGYLPSAEFDEDGAPIPSVAEWSEPVECFIEDITEDRRRKTEGGVCTDRRYEVLVEGGKCDVDDLVQLTRRDENLGVYAVSRVKPISLDRVKIFV